MSHTTPRLAFLRHLIALLESQPNTPFLGQLKTLLTGPELSVASDVAVPWDITYFIAHLNALLGAPNAEFLTALVAALNNRAKLPALDRFPEAQPAARPARRAVAIAVTVPSTDAARASVPRHVWR